MRLFLILPYILGALVSLVSAYFLDATIATIITLIVPFILLAVLEGTGRISFHRVKPSNSVLVKSQMEGLSDKESANKYGWAIINEMDGAIKETENQLAEMRQTREEFATMVKGDHAVH